MRNSTLEAESGIQHSEFNINQNGADVIEVTWRTPLGEMTGRVGSRGVKELRFPRHDAQAMKSEHDAVEVLGMTPSDGGAEHAAVMAQVKATTEFLRDYFAGRPAGRGPRLDWDGARPFDRAVWEATVRIGRGRTRSYGEIAAEIGRPGAARAVGGALGRNPLVLLVPCHRVIASTGGKNKLCGFTGGLDLKRWLLQREGMIFE